MARGRRAAVAGACALVVLAGPPAAIASPAGGTGTAALRDLVRARLDSRDGARAASAAAVAARLSARAEDRRGGLRALAARPGPARVIVGLRSPADAASAARLLRRYGERVEAIPRLAAVAVSVRSPARLAAALARRPEVAYAEPAARRAFLDPADDVDPATHIPYDWAYGLGPSYIGVNAGPALAAAGGGSAYPVAVVDSGVDRSHPDLDGNVTRAHDAFGGQADPGDVVGHGTFVAGLIGAEGDNGLGLRGAAGRTDVYAVRVGGAEGSDPATVAEGIVWAADHGARVINISLGSTEGSQTERRALEYAFQRDVLPVAAAGNTGDNGNATAYPAAWLGGARGGIGIGLSVAATTPAGTPAPFSTHNDFVSVAAPGSARDPDDCDYGVYSTLSSVASLWDRGTICGRYFGAIGNPERYAYGSGTSFSAPLAAGVASVVWTLNRDLSSEQVAHVLTRSARQTIPAGWNWCGGRSWWNRCTGRGVVDGGAAAALAARYDTTAPRARVGVRRQGPSRLRVRVSGVDRTRPGRELAGRVDATLYTSRDRRRWRRYAGPRPRSLARTLRLSRRRLYLEALVCDANVNCAVVRRGPFRAGRR